jgi:undecaprenyl-diphosphatase
MIRGGLVQPVPPVQVGELGWCLRANHLGSRPRVRRLFATVSRLGDGVAWYMLMLLLPLLDGTAGLHASLHLALVGLVALGLYRGLKRYTRRPRPYARHRAITAHVAPLDEFSFPSGHTLHAVAFTLVATAYYPLLGLLLWPFAVLIALSRVVLGLHYPSDVLAATAIAVALSRLSFAIIA